MGFQISLRNVPGTQNTIELPEGASMGDLEKHIDNFSGKVVRVNGAEAAPETALKDGDKVVASKAPKGA